MKQYHYLLKKIRASGVIKQDVSRETETLSCFGTSIHHPMELGFPAVNTKKLYYDSVVKELLWFLRGERTVDTLINEGCNIWNKDAVAHYNNKLSKGLTFNERDLKNRVKEGAVSKYTLGDLGPVYGKQWRSGYWVNDLGTVRPVDQFKNLLDGLLADPAGRRHIISAWNVGQLEDMALPPCHVLYQFNAYDTKGGKQKLDLMWYQRSADVFLGLPFNIASYATLLEIVARLVGREPGTLIGTIGDAHIYREHLYAVDTQLKRNPDKHALPVLGGRWKKKIQPLSIGFEAYQLNNLLYSLRYSDFELEGYEHDGPIRAEMLAPKS